MKLPRFRDPRDTWPPLGTKPPAPLPGPHGQQRAILAMVVPSLPEARREEIAPLMCGQRWMWRVLADMLQEHEPRVFDGDALSTGRECGSLTGRFAGCEAEKEWSDGD